MNRCDRCCEGFNCLVPIITIILRDRASDLWIISQKGCTDKEEDKYAIVSGRYNPERHVGRKLTEG